MTTNNDSAFDEPIFDVAQLVSVELFSPKVDETLAFFKDLLGLVETGREGDSVYLKAYEDWYTHSLKVTYRDTPGVGQNTWRTTSPQALQRRVDALASFGRAGDWTEDRGQGPTYRFTDTAGHIHGLLWDVEYFQPSPEERSPLLSRPQKRPLHGVPVRRIDHVNHLVNDVTLNREFLRDALGFRLRENVRVNGNEIAAWMSVSPLVHEIANLGDQSGQSADQNGRLHHLAFWYGYPQHLNDIADIFRERGIEIEAGPAKHGISQAEFLYVFEPGGNRIELFGDSGYLIFDPAWKPLTWTEDDLADGIIWFGGKLPDEYFTYGTPQRLPSQYSTHNAQTYALAEAQALLQES